MSDDYACGANVAGVEAVVNDITSYRLA